MRLSSCIRLAVLGSVLLSSASATIILNTGTGDDGSLSALGSVEATFPATAGHWLFFPTLCCGEGFPTDVLNNTFLAGGAFSGAPALANSTAAQWVGVQFFGSPHWANSSDANFLEFRIPFVLTAGEAATFTLQGTFRITGDFESVKVNGTSIGYTDFAADFGQASHSLSIANSYFTTGTNTLGIVQRWTTATAGANGGGNFNPAVFFEQTVTPEPGTWALGGTALLALGWLRRRKSSR